MCVRACVCVFELSLCVCLFACMYCVCLCLSVCVDTENTGIEASFLLSNYPHSPCSPSIRSMYRVMPIYRVSVMLPHTHPLQIEDYSLVQFLPLNMSQEDTISDVMLYIDNAIQYGEDLDVKVPKVWPSCNARWT